MKITVRAPRFAFWKLLLLLFLPLYVGCQATYETRDWSTYEGPGAQYFQEEEMEFPHDLMTDPLEPVNRSISGFNYVILYGLIQPVAWVYSKIFPEVVRTHIGQAFTNALWPGRVLNNLLQGKWGGAGRETERFLINTTVGIGGLFDPAKAKWEIEPSNEDLGQTFHKWGWRHSMYFVLPIFGPTTVRDGVGKIGDFFADPLTYVDPPTGSYIQYYRSFNKLTPFIPTIVDFVQHNYDPYQLSKMLFILNREIQTEDYSTESADTGETETLESVFFAPEDEEWGGEGKTRTIPLPNGKEVTYTAWMQDDPGPCLFFIPGTGGHREGDSSLAVSEYAYGNGRSVVTISSALNFEFVGETLTGGLPGFMPSDSRDAHIALDAIYHDLERRHPGRITKRWLAGLSLGAMTTLYIAAAEEDPENTLIDFDLYCAIDCPISLEHAVRQLDGFFNAPLQFPPEERYERVRGLLRKVLDLGTSGDLNPSDPLPFVEWEARFLIGFSFRLTSTFIIYQTQALHDQNVLRTERSNFKRSMSYRECTTFSFIEYMYAFVLPHYSKMRDDINFDEAGARRLFSMCDIRSLESRIRGNEKVLYFSNRNDPLLRPEDIRWAEQAFGDRATIFAEGGHLGNMNEKSVRMAITEAAERVGNGPEQRP